jgi:hypothetical protein
MKRKRGPSDGEIYEAVSRKANPDLYAEAARVILEIEAEDRAKLKNGDKDWTSPCLNCDAVPTMHPTKLCGPCCTGEAETAGGNW